MKHFSILACLMVILSSCIKEENPNIEADIIEVLSNQEGILNVIYRSNSIDVYADATKVDPSSIALTYILSEGATIAPSPENVTDYSTPQRFVVTSENKEWSKQYTIRVLFQELPTKFDFEHWYQPKGEKYKMPFAYNEELNDSTFIWSCGNEPYAFITGKYDDYTSFPTQPTTTAAEGNYAAKLETKLTGDYYKPMAAGSLFIGQYDGSKYDPLESTQFGFPFTKKPLRIVGKYKYRSGGKTLKSNVDDCCRILAVLYKTDENTPHLNGYTIKNSQNIVARAEMPTGGGDTPGDGFATFDLEFVYSQDIDVNLLKAGGYNIAINFSASINGDIYDGADGSVLLIDDVELICDPNF